VTSAFTHSGMLHILMNMMSLLQLGGSLVSAEYIYMCPRCFDIYIYHTYICMFMCI
jgi:hypothetical protein